MTDLYLRASDEPELLEALDAAGWLGADGNPLKGGTGFALDVIGTLYGPNEMDGDTVVRGEPLDGYHANVRLVGIDLPEVLEPFAINPATPQRVWA